MPWLIGLVIIVRTDSIFHISNGANNIKPKPIGKQDNTCWRYGICRTNIRLFGLRIDRQDAMRYATIFLKAFIDVFGGYSIDRRVNDDKGRILV